MMRKLNQDIVLKKPNLILFDTDNTLYDYTPANKAAEEAVFIKAKNLIGIDKKKFFEYYSKAKYEVKLNLSNTASSHSRLLYFQRMIELLGCKAELLLALDLEQTFWRAFLANAPLFPNVQETLCILRNHKVPIGVVTDLTSHIQLRKLTYFGLEDTFDAVVTSEEVGKDKPDQRNFELILNKLQIDSSNNFWMVGDNAKADIYGAKKKGAITFQKIHNNVKLGKNECQPDFMFSDYSSFINMINKFL